LPEIHLFLSLAYVTLWLQTYAKPFSYAKNISEKNPDFGPGIIFIIIVINRNAGYCKIQQVINE
jgi:hypothetical protein